MAAYPITSFNMEVIGYPLTVAMIPSEAVIARSHILLLPPRSFNPIEFAVAPDVDVHDCKVFAHLRTLTFISKKVMSHCEQMIGYLCCCHRNVDIFLCEWPEYCLPKKILGVIAATRVIARAQWICECNGHRAAIVLLLLIQKFFAFEVNLSSPLYKVFIGRVQRKWSYFRVWHCWPWENGRGGQSNK